ncbi:MAG TPA: FtsX-like permease family protein [Myxococcales bacterium]|nr:FtsX-like permease family protein [Myxococcales bacterium]
MTLAGLALRNAFFRNKTRAFLTVLGTIVAALAFVFLRSILTAWYASSEASAADRVVTRNAISLINPLPLSYRQRIAAVPGVTQVTFSNWFGGYYKDRKNFFANFAIEPKSALEVFDLRFAQGTPQAFIADRNSCIVGRELAKRFGWKVGDVVPLISEIYPGDWRFTIAGIVYSPDDETISNNLFFHWARLNEGLPESRKDTVGLYTIKIANPNDSTRVIRDIDTLFANSDNETHSETEKAFRLNFVAGSSAILSALEVVSIVILVIMALILGNTLAMGLRERTSELGTMRAIGFLPRQVRALSIAEGALLGLIGGVIGVAAAPPALAFAHKILTLLGFGFLLPMRPAIAALTIIAAAAIGSLASAIPAWQAGRLDVVSALRKQE